MSKIQIPRTEFTTRLERIQAAMAERRLELLIVYGDEYRKENLRYVCNFWPIFERAACFIPRRGLPVLAGAPEGAVYAREMCVWPDIRNVKEFACVTVPEEIDYPLATFSSFREIIADTAPRGGKIALVGWWSAIPTALVIWGLVLMALSEKKPEPATTAEKLLGFLSLLWLFRRR